MVFKANRNIHPQIVLVGQPNCGKSTIFNTVAGYKSISTNFPGVTVQYTKSHITVDNRVFDLVDLPGTYSLISSDRAEFEAKKYLLNNDIHTIINVIDASILSRSLELSLQLLEFKLPLIICLNMMDEAFRKGISIDSKLLSQILQVPVIETTGIKGTGIGSLFACAAQHINVNRQPLQYSRHVEQVISALARDLSPVVHHNHRLPSRLLAIKLLEKDKFFTSLYPVDAQLKHKIDRHEKKLYKDHGQVAEEVISSDRHSKAMNLFENVATLHHPHKSLRDKVDDILIHPVWGYFFMLGLLFLFFIVIFQFGSIVETPILKMLDAGLLQLGRIFNTQSLTYQIISGMFQGIVGGIAIVLPYLLPFLIGMSLLEDSGYLPRVAFLMDAFMHRIGLHGVAIIPMMLGYGCSVPAVMATRILASQRDRFIVSVISILIPCSARMTIIFGLVGYYLGGAAAFGIYIINLVVIILTGKILSRLMPEDTPGMVLEMPSYKYPAIRVIFAKTRLRMKEFIIIAWPLLIAGSIVLGLAQWYNFDVVLNRVLSPLTLLLGLPVETGTTLIFGLLRKELSMLMLFQALGTQNLSAVMTSVQMFTFTLFVVFYFPCAATFGVLLKEIGWKRALLASCATIVLAMGIALMGRGVGSLF